MAESGSAVTRGGCWSSPIAGSVLVRRAGSLGGASVVKKYLKLSGHARRDGEERRRVGNGNLGVAIVPGDDVI